MNKISPYLRIIITIFIIIIIDYGQDVDISLRGYFFAHPVDFPTAIQWLKYAGSRWISDPGPKRNVKKRDPGPRRHA